MENPLAAVVSSPRNLERGVLVDQCRAAGVADVDIQAALENADIVSTNTHKQSADAYGKRKQCAVYGPIKLRIPG